MLAQNFMTADALGITEEQRQALILTLRFFEHGEVPHHRFHMNFWNFTKKGCDTIHCIGGWAEVLAQEEGLFQDTDFFDVTPLSRLFFPRSQEASACEDVEKGAHALRNYLTTGEAQWDEVMQP